MWMSRNATWGFRLAIILERLAPLRARPHHLELLVSAQQLLQVLHGARLVVCDQGAQARPVGPPRSRVVIGSLPS